MGLKRFLGGFTAPEIWDVDISSLTGAKAGAYLKTLFLGSQDREIIGNTGFIAAATPTDCSAIIGQSGKRSILQGGIIRGVQILNAGKKVTVRAYKYNGSGWNMVDKYDVTKDSGLEVNIGHVAHNDYMSISIEHNDSVNRAFTYVFVIQDME